MCSFSPSIVIFFNSISFAVDILNGIVDNELYLKIPYAFNTTHRDCVWRDAFKDRKLCTEEVKIWLNSNGYEEMVTNKKIRKTSDFMTIFPFLSLSQSYELY